MARRTAETKCSAGAADEVIQALEPILAGSGNPSSLDSRLALLAQLRKNAAENEAAIDRQLLTRLTRMDEALSAVEQQQGELRQLIDCLTTPPFFPAVFLGLAGTPRVAGAIVQTGSEQRVVQIAKELPREQFAPGDEVFLSQERNFIVAKSETAILPTGEVADYSRHLADGRVVLRSRDEELVVVPGAALRDQELKAGDAVRFNRLAGLALERIESSRGEDYFIETTPTDSFDDIGGLDREIEELKRMLALHFFHGEMTRRYKLPRRRSVLMQGPPGNGKTRLARSTCRWLAGLSPGARSRFIHVKPGALNSVWYGATEQRYREIFRVAREAAAAGSTPVVMFFDEIDAIGAARGGSHHRIDDRMLNAFMAELDGLEERGNIVVMAATNRLDALDPALLRPGRLGDLVLNIPRPKKNAARLILSRHMPADIPYAANGEGPSVAREALLDMAVGQLFASTTDTELAILTLRDGKRRVVRAADLLSGAHLEAIAHTAMERACVREAEGGPAGITSADMGTAVSRFMAAAPGALTPVNARDYLHDLPEDVDVVRVDMVEHRLNQQHRYCVEAA